MYYTPKELECKTNIMIKGLDCKSRTSDSSQWCENCKEKYLKVANPSVGTGAFLNNAFYSVVIDNPPYACQKSELNNDLLSS